MVARAYGADAVPDGDAWVDELGNGFFNVVYRLTLADGRQVALKSVARAALASPPHSGQSLG
ncbi:hypothetical protein [Promicromonospora soli]